MHLKLTNGQPEKYSIGQLRRDNPNTSFPKAPSDALLADWDVYPYTRPEQPAYDPLTARVVDGGFKQDAFGNWFMPWVVEQLPQDQAEGDIRRKRGRLLSDTDWTQVADAPVDQSAWAAYRQELRDITTQDGFPYSVDWPTEPTA